MAERTEDMLNADHEDMAGARIALGDEHLGEGHGGTEAGGTEPGGYRRSPTGGIAFGATQEPEYVTLPPDGRSSDPYRGQHYPGAHPALGPTSEDDPPFIPHTYPTTGNEGDMTLVAVFENHDEALSCLEHLGMLHPQVETALVHRHGSGPEQGTRPGNVITGPEFGDTPTENAEPEDKPMGAPVAVGATLGATLGLLAATYIHPVAGTIVATGPLISTLAGAGLGSFLGGLWEVGARDNADDATMYPGEVRHGGVILLARVRREEADAVRQSIDHWAPLEIRVQ